MTFTMVESLLEVPGPPGSEQARLHCYGSRECQEERGKAAESWRALEAGKLMPSLGG